MSYRVLPILFLFLPLSYVGASDSESCAEGVCKPLQSSECGALKNPSKALDEMIIQSVNQHKIYRDNGIIIEGELSLQDQRDRYLGYDAECAVQRHQGIKL